MPFIVVARRPISSCTCGSGTRRLRSRAPIPATSARIASTGLSARPTTNQLMRPTSSNSNGNP